MSHPDEVGRQPVRGLVPLLASAATAFTLLVAAVIVHALGPAPARAEDRAQSRAQQHVGVKAPEHPVSHAVAAVAPLPADCTPTPHPPPTQYGFVARVQKGTMEGPNLSINGMDVSVCGVITLIRAQTGSGCSGIQGELFIPADGVIVNTMAPKLTTIPNHPLPIPVTVHATPTRTPIRCGSSSGGLKADLKVALEGSTGLFGLQCRIPLGGDLHTVITGRLLNPPYQGTVRLSGSLRAGKVRNNDKWCPGLLPKRIDAIAGLPGNGYRANWPGKVSIYQPTR